MVTDVGCSGPTKGEQWERVCGEGEEPRQQGDDCSHV